MAAKHGQWQKTLAAFTETYTDIEDMLVTTKAQNLQEVKQLEHDLEL